MPSVRKWWVNSCPGMSGTYTALFDGVHDGARGKVGVDTYRAAIIPGFPILAVFRLKGQPKRDGSITVRSCEASQSPVYPTRDAFAVVEHPSCRSSSSSCPLPVQGPTCPISRGNGTYLTTTEALSASQRGRHEESHTVLQEIAALSSLSAADGDSHDVAQGHDLDELAAARGPAASGGASVHFTPTQA